MFHPGDTIGPYTLVRALGRGAFGEVWLADRASSMLTTQVALKLPLDAAADLEAIRQEAQLWLKASGHTNIVPVLEAEVYDGQIIIASEYVAGGSLSDWLKQHGGKTPSVEAAVTIMRGVLEGLQHLHESGLVHRDLKPSNVLMQKGRPRLTDFGLTRVLKSSGHTTNIAGTPGYMAPEAFKGHYSPASDIWAVGILLHKLLTGVLPYPHTDFYSLLLAITSDEAVKLSDQVPDALRPVLAIALAKPVSDRYTSAAEMTEALASPSGSAPVSPPQARHNLPIQMTSFIGREQEIAQVRASLAKTRLLTLTGSGGCGKTRLLLQVARDVQDDYSEGVWLVELAPLSDPVLVPQALASVLGIREEPGKTLTQSLSETLSSKQMLLLLDNCEHVLDAAATLSDTLLKSCPRVKVFASSREGLGFAGESSYQVPSLSVPDIRQPQTPEHLAQYEAVQLFIERAVMTNAGFAITDQNAPAVASVCHRLDGIPLAIELAAARVRSLAVEQIAARLDDRFRILTGGSRTALPRQQTLRAMIDWSYDLLEENQKALFARLSVFMGGWTLEAAEAVCVGGTVETREVLDLLTSLADKSLIITEEQGTAVRYRLLETVRQYARDRLVESGEGEAVREQHQTFFVALAEEAAPQFQGPQQSAWMDRLDREHDNIRAALEWGNNGAALRIAGALWYFWDVRGYLSEGRAWLTAVLAAADAQAHTHAQAKALAGAGSLARSQGDFAAAQTLHRECLAVYQDLGDKDGIARSLNNLGYVAHSQGDYAAARTLHEQSLAIERELGNKQGIAWSLHNLGMIARMQGEYTVARSLHEESLALFRDMGNRQGIAWSLLNIGYVAQKEGDYAAARPLCEESLALQRELGNRGGISYSLKNLGEIAYHQGDYALARRLYEESLGIERELGDNRDIAYLLTHIGNIALIQGDCSSARSLHEESLEIQRASGNRAGIAASLNNLGDVANRQGDDASARCLHEKSAAIYWELGDKCGIAYCLEAFASLAAKEKKSERAVGLWGAAAALREAISSPLPPNDREKLDQDAAAARESLGAEVFAAEWEKGRALTIEQAIAVALGEADL